jgi:hypothetical protein
MSHADNRPVNDWSMNDWPMNDRTVDHWTVNHRSVNDWPVTHRSWMDNRPGRRAPTFSVLVMLSQSKARDRER